MDETHGIECVWSDPKEHPQCPHGPTLLFSRYIDGKSEQFYACSACRDRKLCRFYLKHGEKLNKQKKVRWDQERKKFTSRYVHQKLYIRFNEIMAETPERRSYCHDCEKLIFTSEKDKHNDHKITEGLTDYQMSHPSDILRPLDDSKKEAQYFFSRKSTEEMVNMLVKLGAKQILCIGTPRIHEYIMEKHENEISSLLLDFDGRFHTFFGPLNYCWYNLLNHHFFNENAAEVFKDFLTQNNGEGTYLICDPPFGVRLEALSWSLKRISDLYRKWNNIKDENDKLKIVFIFPYFMESVMKHKSTPPSISGGLKDLQMSDYKVDYDNHPLFVTKVKNNKLPSPIRIFTNIPLSLLELPESDGYKHCKRCKKWVSSENKHCKKCKACTSKNGRTYKHCNVCKRCVKPSWKHCGTCERCTLEKHQCGQKPKFVGRCLKCDKQGHTEKECGINRDDQNDTLKSKKAKKRKHNEENGTVTKKKIKKLPTESEEGKSKESVKADEKSLPKGLKKKKKLQSITSPKLKAKSLKKPKTFSKLHKKTKLRVPEGTESGKKKLRKRAEQGNV